ncbi:hypothetical protein QTI24_26640 [Variovorax sp. J22P240]|uniref:hypothetical protein n=1 Tax=Variovorax sp. J22P240 TaxID=3053514 RepID=UPI002578901F|nr:hypothetical protein [Variovorax sp. J22P240]MDM0002211.1 hypothetical protein [Variovorax sp. J22P240]
MPFAPPEKHSPHVTPEMARHGDKVYENLEREVMTAALQDRMGIDAQLPLDPPTLRDNIEAAWTARAPEET